MSNLHSFKCHGGKGRLSKFIIENLPKDYIKYTYCELYGGSAAVLLNKLPSTTEILNDINFSTYCIYWAFQKKSKELLARLSLLGYNESTFKHYQGILPKSRLDIAERELVLSRFSRGGLKKNFAWSDRLRGGRPGDENAWLNFIDNISTIANRLKNVEIYNLPALDLLKKYDGPEHIIYLDPTYMPSTRTVNNIYEHEMSILDHRILLDVIIQSKSKILISGYNSDLYNSTFWFDKWTKIEKKVKNNSGQGKKKNNRTEVLWKNY